MAVVAYNPVTTTFVARDESLGTTILSTGSSGTFGLKEVPAKANGTFTVLPGGTRFRKATARSTFKFELTPGARQSWSGIITSNGHRTTNKSSVGGYTSNRTFIEFRANGTFSSPLGGFNANYFPQIPQGMRNEAVTKALLKLADQKVNLGENLATLGQTIRLFAGVTHTLVDSLSAAYKDKTLRPYLLRSWRSIERQGVDRFIAGKYLEYVYGWKPLVQDVYSLYELARHGFVKDLVLHSKGSSHQQGRNAEKHYVNVSDQTETWQEFVEERTRVTCHLWARLDPNWQGARAFNQLGLLNPYSLVWELTPWSFVVDWVLPIGSVLSALSSIAGLIFIDGSIASRVSASGPYKSGTYYPNSNRTWDSKDMATGTCDYEGYRRENLTNWPLPGLWLDPDPLRGDRPFKALALAIGNLHGMRKSTLG